MQLRWTLSVGLPVTDEEATDALGKLSGIVLQPDTGKIEGFFVQGGGLWPGQQLFLSSLDILRWGTHVSVRSADVLGPSEDRIRVQSLLAQARPILGQPIMTENGRVLGRCADVQFDTEHFDVQWLFPRRWLRWGVALPVSQIIEVRKDAVIVRNTAAPEKESKTEDTLPLLPRLPEAA